MIDQPVLDINSAGIIPVQVSYQFLIWWEKWIRLQLEKESLDFILHFGQPAFERLGNETLHQQALMERIAYIS